MSEGAKVIELFARPMGERVADKVVPPLRTPHTLEEFSDAGALQVRRDQVTGTVGTWLAVGLGVVVYLGVRDWRQQKRSKAKPEGSST